MHWGFPGDGWYTIIDVISMMLSKSSTEEVIASQVKEKFGSLRYYYSGSQGDFIRGAVAMAELISGMTCDKCGMPGEQTSGGGWVTTKCAKHCPEGSGKAKQGSLGIRQIKGIGEAWSSLIVTLENACEFHAKHNQMPAAIIRVEKKNAELDIIFIGGDDRTAGMVDFVIHYAKRIDEHSGEPHL